MKSEIDWILGLGTLLPKGLNEEFNFSPSSLEVPLPVYTSELCRPGIYGLIRVTLNKTWDKINGGPFSHCAMSNLSDLGTDRPKENFQEGKKQMVCLNIMAAFVN